MKTTDEIRTEALRLTDELISSGTAPAIAAAVLIVEAIESLDARFARMETLLEKLERNTAPAYTATNEDRER